MELITLEICSFSYEGCLSAQRGGGKRVELCSNPFEGGTTPSYGLIKKVKEEIDITLYPIIRPRGGDFFYNRHEFDIMLEDIRFCKEIGCNGIATGVQKADGKLDTERMKKMVDLAYPMRVTCIRVFDLVPDMFKAIDELIDAGCERVLTSGQATHAADAAEKIARLVSAAGERIIIMPGSGIRADNIDYLVKTTKAKEYHTSARKYIASELLGNHSILNDFGSKVDCDEAQIREIKRIAETSYCQIKT